MKSKDKIPLIGSYSSMRTRLPLVSATILLIILSAFYIGGIILFDLHAHDVDSVISQHILEEVRSMAVNRMTIFVMVVGIIAIVPIFLIQSKMILDPISKMRKEMHKIASSVSDTDCPRINWEGKDEFADLALSANAMLETISSRTISLANTEARLKALIACIPDQLAIFDKNGILLSLPKSATAEDAIIGFQEGKEIDWQIYGKEVRSSFYGELSKALRDEETDILQLDCKNMPKENARRYELRFAKYEGSFILVVIRDITDESIAKERLAEDEKRLELTKKQESLSFLAAGIAHDVNNLLSVLLNTAELSLGYVNDENADGALNVMREAIKRGSSMMNELMTYAGETGMVFRKCDPSKLLLDAEKLASSLVDERITVVCDLPEGLPAVDADPNQIWKVFFNLIKNASEAMKDRIGTLKIATREFEMTETTAKDFRSSSLLKPGKGILFIVSDTGSGIPKEFAKRIFDPYITNKGVGRGLGLATCAAIVEAHSGGISITSEEGRGTTFSVFLPISTKEDTNSDETLLGGVVNRSKCKEVLIIDDDQAILKTTSMLLKIKGYTAITASKYQDALAEFRRHADSLRLVLLDANIDKVDTARLLAALKAADQTVPVIISSGDTESKIKGIFNETRYDGFLPKPYTIAELTEMIGGAS